MRLALAGFACLAALAAPAAAQGAFDQGRPDSDKPAVRFKEAPFRTVRPDRPEIILPVATVERPGARLRRLDKMTGATETLEMQAGQEAVLGRLSIRLEACVSPPDGGLKGTRAFLQVWDARDERGEPAFSGWMFADSPALSALDHPRFDVWVISCTTS